MKTKLVAIAIPIYKEIPSSIEIASLSNCFKVLSRYPFFFVCPDNLNLQFYKNFIKSYNVEVSICSFNSKFFDSLKTYNNLMLDINFYKTFKSYKYLLIHQLDAWVFRDELKYWCSLGYDYIGAPWFHEYHDATAHSELYPIAGNGGFSLRKIESFIDILSVIRQRRYINLRLKSIRQINSELHLPLLKKYLVFKKFFSKKNKLLYYLNNFNEDLVIVNCFNKVNSNFRLTPCDVGLKFSFEAQPMRLYEMNNNKLPFGCHAFVRYDFDFWKQFINLNLD